MVYNSLTAAPRNLKECIDWLIAVKGSSRFNTQVLGYALYNFLVDKPVGLTLVPSLEKVKRLSKEFLQNREFQNVYYSEDLLGRFLEPMNKTDGINLKRFAAAHQSDYENVVRTGGLKPDHMAARVDLIASSCAGLLESITNPALYESAYSSEATWEASCSKNPAACAVILVGIAPMLYAGLHALSIGSDVKSSKTSTHAEVKRMGKVMKAMGFGESECRDGLTHSKARQAVRCMHNDLLEVIYDIAGFWAFY